MKRATSLRIGLTLAMASLLPVAATAAAPATRLSGEELRWLCEQPSVARVKVTRVAVDAPDTACDDASTERCRMVTAEVVVLESLPLLGAAPGLSLKAYLSEAPNRVRVQMASRDYVGLRAPPFALVGSVGLMGMRALPEDAAGKPTPLLLGVVLSGEVPGGDLDAACKPIRHWSGQRHPALPAALPGDHPARTETAQQLARRLAGLAGPRPPEPAALEQRFGTRLVTAGLSSGEASSYRGLARLEASWLRLWRRSWTDSNGRARVNMITTLTDPYAEDRAKPWWDDDPSDRAHKMTCIRPSMVLKELGEEWPRAALGPPYDRGFQFRYPDYEVTISFLPHGYPIGPRESRNISDACIDSMYVSFSPR